MDKLVAKLFWGVLLIVFDFRIGSIDLVPDIIGGTLIAMGCVKLAQESKLFLVAAFFAWALVVLSVAIYAFTGKAALRLGMVIAMIDVLTMWFLLGAIQELAGNRGLTKIAKSFERRKYEYTSAAVVVIFLFFLMPSGGVAVALLAMLPSLLVIIILCSILHLLHRLKLALVSLPAVKH